MRSSGTVDAATAIIASATARSNGEAPFARIHPATLSSSAAASGCSPSRATSSSSAR